MSPCDPGGFRRTTDWKAASPGDGRGTETEKKEAGWDDPLERFASLL